MVCDALVETWLDEREAVCFIDLVRPSVLALGWEVRVAASGDRAVSLNLAMMVEPRAALPDKLQSTIMFRLAPAEDGPGVARLSGL